MRPVIYYLKHLLQDMDEVPQLPILRVERTRCEERGITWRLLRNRERMCAREGERERVRTKTQWNRKGFASHTLAAAY